MTVNLYIGHDEKMATNTHVMIDSILEYTTVPVRISLIQTHLIKEYTRPIHPNQSTSFSFSRFLVPYLNNYQGWALFMDSDMLFLDDIAKLWNLKDSKFDVQVVQHADYVCNNSNKFFNIQQTNYLKKNWSSVMLFNCANCTRLTPEYVNTATPAELHQFMWTNNVGALDPKWNYLVGEASSHDPSVAVLHYTYGTPLYTNNCPVELKNIWEQRLKNLFKFTDSKL